MYVEFCTILGDEVTNLHLEHIWLDDWQTARKGRNGSRRCLNTHCIIAYQHHMSSSLRSMRIRRAIQQGLGGFIAPVRSVTERA